MLHNIRQRQQQQQREFNEGNSDDKLSSLLAPLIRIYGHDRNDSVRQVWEFVRLFERFILLAIFVFDFNYYR